MVEAIAKLLHPGGIEVGLNGVHEAFADTLQLLNSRPEVTLFEATVLHENLCARIDILRKQGTQLQLIEVKAKSIDSECEPHPFRKKNGAISNAWEPYLADVAYQTWLLRANFPDSTVTPFVCLVDKAQTLGVEGIVAQFRLVPAPDDGRRYRRSKVTFLDDLERLRAKNILAFLDVTDEVAELMPGVLEEAIHLAATLHNGCTKLRTAIGVQCRDCEYRNATTAADARDGFRECWGDLADENPHILDYYKPGLIKRDGELLVNTLVQQGTAGMAEIDPSDLVNANGTVGKDQARRLLQRKHTLLDEEYRSPELSELVKAWRYPLHFVDFETSRIAVPYHAGMRPYEQVAFQWSCHRVDRPEAEPRHFEWINTVDAYPNVEFAQTLRDCVGDTGTVLTWWHHEASVLKDINGQLVRYGCDDRELSDWLTRVVCKEGPQPLCMVDLGQIAKAHYFHPQMKGSLSLKFVMPAVWASNPRLHVLPAFARYCHHDPRGQLRDPYGTLPPLPFGTMEETAEEIVKDGGGAMRAYQEMMYGLRKHDATQRENWRRLLLQYCRLDTAAMVMVWMHWAEPKRTVDAAVQRRRQNSRRYLARPARPRSVWKRC